MQTTSPKTPRAVRGRSLGKKVRPRSTRSKSDAPSVIEPESPYARGNGKRVRSARGPDEPRKAALRRDRKAGMRPEPIKVRERKHLSPEALKARSEVRRARHKQRKLAALKALLAEIEAEKAA